MPIEEVDTSHTTRPWILVVHRATDRGEIREYHRYETRADAERSSLCYHSPDVYLIELMVDAGCLWAVG